MSAEIETENPVKGPKRKRGRPPNPTTPAEWRVALLKKRDKMALSGKCWQALEAALADYAAIPEVDGFADVDALVAAVLAGVREMEEAWRPQ